MICPKCGTELSENARRCNNCGWATRTIEEFGYEQTRFDLGPRTILADRFVLVRKLGQGGMGEVWLAQDQDLDGQSVAVKILKADLARDQLAISSMREEVKIARSLSHPNIIRIHDLHQHAGIYFISMEYVDGESVHSIRARDGGRLTLDQVMPWADPGLCPFKESAAS